MYLPIFYQDPLDCGPLVQELECFRNPRTGAVYPIQQDIPDFLAPGGVDGPNSRYQKLYDSSAMRYDLSAWLAGWTGGRESKSRKICLDLLELDDEASVLEVSVGTGLNWPYLGKKPHLYGVDVSANMLARCRRRAERLKLRARLCRGLAEHLPYPNSSFDCVFHFGGINGFSDPAAALREMVRVARRGTLLVVADMTEEAATRNQDRMLTGDLFKNRPRKIEPPIGLLPAGMQEVGLQITGDGELYVLTFRKPMG